MTAQAEPDRSSREQLLHRIADHKIDLTKSYPKRADGVVDCGTDPACFVVMAERCEPAVLDYDSRDKAMMMTKRIHAVYRIAGRDGQSCTVQRLALEREMEVRGEARDALLKQGRSAVEIEAMRAEAIMLLHTNTPDRLTCSFAGSRVLELALGIYEKSYIDGHFRELCHEPGPSDAWPVDLVSPSSAAE